MQNDSYLSRRAATLEELTKPGGVISNFISPVPPHETLRAWFDKAGIQRIKANPDAKRGGGPCYYDVAGIEKFFRTRMLPAGGVVSIRGHGLPQ